MSAATGVRCLDARAPSQEPRSWHSLAHRCGNRARRQGLGEMAEQGALGAGRAADAVSGAWHRDLFAGSIGGVLSVAYSLSYAALIFSGPLSPWLAYGVSASLVTAAVAASVVAARSSLPF